MAGADARVERGLGNVVWLDEVDRTSTSSVGEKAAALGALTRAGFPVPRGFVITADAYLAAMERAGVRDELREGARQLGDQLSAAAGEHLHTIVRRAGIPLELRLEIADAYHRLGERPFVAVRSSVIDPELAASSCHAEAFINVRGVDEVVACIAECWAWLFGTRACSDRGRCARAGEPVIGVLVQEMVDAISAGVVYTTDPSPSGEGRLVIESTFGLGECLVGHAVEPDVHVVDRDGLVLLSTQIGTKAYRLVRHREGGQHHSGVDHGRARTSSLSYDDVIELARIGVEVEAHAGAPQAIDWVIAHDGVSIVGTRPIR